MIKIGDICPLFFNPIKNKFQQDIDYIQRFHTNDNVLIQIFSNNSSHTVRAYLRNLIAGTQSSISLLEYEVNDSTKMYYSNITGYIKQMSLNVAKEKAATYTLIVKEVKS